MGGNVAGSDPKIRVRMYRQGLGDCFLLTVRTGPEPVHMRFACGTLAATTTAVRMRDVVANIASETKSHIHLLIATHEHKDHLSGFNSERKAFKPFKVDHAWAAWTENPADGLARDLKVFKNDLVSSLRLAGEALRVSGLPRDHELRAVGSGVRGLAG